MTEALARIPYARELNIKPLLMGDELTLILPYAPHIIGNPILKALHGGAVGAFMETAAIVQLWLMGDPKPLPKPIGINIDYLRRGKPKDTYARAIVSRQGSRVANVHVRAWQESFNAPISTLHGNFLTAKDTD
ncbi:MAG TPA: PaaI family thioesterase [Hellea balneolensis]|uniref:PaaI family thioesterase n=1 Tax=Hellea balneolensis TaxID=287478 RepID=A0A7C5QXQ3_9PROT|nr:PaaI family thioesterase [Hellea balneolensis]